MLAVDVAAEAVSDDVVAAVDFVTVVVAETD